MAELNLDQRRAERGAADGHRVTVGGSTHTLPAVLPLATLSTVADAIADATGGELTIEATDATALMRVAPALVDALATGLDADWIRQLDPDEFMAVLGLYDLGGQGEASAS